MAEMNEPDLSAPRTEAKEPASLPPVEPPPPPEPVAVTPAAPVTMPPPAPPIRPAQKPRRGGGSAALIACLVLLLLGLAGFAWLWRLHTADQRRVVALEQAQAAGPAQLASLQDELHAMREQVTKLEQRPQPTPPPPPDLGPLTDRIAALEQRPQAPPADPAVAGKLEALSGQTATLGKQLAEAQSQASAAASGAARLQRLQGARTALDAGKPLGSLPDAPPPLARFAAVAPPTEAALRLSFNDAAQAAQAASHPDPAGRGFAGRMWLRAQALVTVKQGDTVLVGTPAAGLLASARQRLDAGDLAGAVHLLEKLDPDALAAMAGWRQQAQALLDARSALDAALGSSQGSAGPGKG